MFLQLTSNAPTPTSLIVVNGQTSTGYALLEAVDWGNPAFDVQYSGYRGTQGHKAVNAIPQDRTVALPIRCYGASKDDLAAKIAAIFTVMSELLRFGGKITYQSNNQTYRQYLTVMAGQNAIQEWGKRAETTQFVATVIVTAVCAPYATGDPLDYTDTFSTDTISAGNYTVDAGDSGNVAISGGTLTPVANLSTNNRFIFTSRGYNYGDMQLTIKSTPGTALSSYKSGVVERVDANTYLEVYVDDDSTNSWLRIDKVVAGVRTTLSSGTVSVRISDGTPFWVRGRFEGNVVTAEYFTSQPTPMGSPTNTRTYTLTGSDATTFGIGASLKAGFSWTPRYATAKLDDFVVEPYTYRNQVLPQQISLSGTIPGDAPALCDVTITPSGGTSTPIWALLAWSPRPGSGLAAAPFGISEVEGWTLTGWSNQSDGNARGAYIAQTTSASSGTTYSATSDFDPSLMMPDDFSSGELSLEVWARVKLSSTLIVPTLTLTVIPGSGTSYGPVRTSDEWGSAGKILVVPNSGTQYRLVRLGTIGVLVDRNKPRIWKWKIDGSVGASSSGTFGIDYVVIVPARARAASMTSVPIANVAPFVGGTTETSKTIWSDLSATISQPPNNGHPDRGLGGQLLEMPATDIDSIVKLSSLVPDDPTSDATSEQLAHNATVHYSITPRYNFIRSS